LYPGGWGGGGGWIRENCSLFGFPFGGGGFGALLGEGNGFYFNFAKNFTIVFFFSNPRGLILGKGGADWGGIFLGSPPTFFFPFNFSGPQFFFFLISPGGGGQKKIFPLGKKKNSRRGGKRIARGAPGFKIGGGNKKTFLGGIFFFFFSLGEKTGGKG